MISTDMYTLTQALENVFIDPKLTDETDNKTGPSFADLDRMEDFWQVKKERKRFLFSILFSRIVYDRNSSSGFFY